MWSVILATLAAICWGVAPVAAKIALSEVSPVVGMGVRSILAASVVTIWLIVTGHYRLLSYVDGSTMAWLVVEAALATVVGDALYFYALQQGAAGQIGTIMASSPIVTLVAADLLLGESTTPKTLLGAALVVAGLILVAD